MSGAPVISGLTKVLFVNDSGLLIVATVPVSGSVNDVLSVTVNCVLKLPIVVKLPAIEIVLLPLLIPVPPYCGDNIDACQTPEVTVPKTDKLLLTTPAPSVVLVKTSMLLIL